MRINTMKEYNVFISVFLINLILFFIKPDIAKQSLVNSSLFFIEVIKFLPPVLILMGLLEVWVSHEKIETHLGKKSRIKGVILSIGLGSAAAGPLLTAFPIALSLSRKGVSTANIVIFLGSWGAIKLPMLFMESRFIGIKFAILRAIITVPFIILIGLLVEKFAPIEKMP